MALVHVLSLFIVIGTAYETYARGTVHLGTNVLVQDGQGQMRTLGQHEVHRVGEGYIGLPGVNSLKQMPTLQHGQGMSIPTIQEVKASGQLNLIGSQNSGSFGIGSHNSGSFGIGSISSGDYGNQNVKVIEMPQSSYGYLDNSVSYQANIQSSNYPHVETFIQGNNYGLNQKGYDKVGQEITEVISTRSKLGDGNAFNYEQILPSTPYNQPSIGPEYQRPIGPEYMFRAPDGPLPNRGPIDLGPVPGPESFTGPVGPEPGPAIDSRGPTPFPFNPDFNNFNPGPFPAPNEPFGNIGPGSFPTPNEPFGNVGAPGGPWGNDPSMFQGQGAWNGGFPGWEQGWAQQGWNPPAMGWNQGQGQNFGQGWGQGNALQGANQPFANPNFAGNGPLPNLSNLNSPENFQSRFVGEVAPVAQVGPAVSSVVDNIEPILPNKVAPNGAGPIPLSETKSF